MNLFQIRHSKLLVIVLVLLVGVCLTLSAIYNEHERVQTEAVQRFITIANQTSIKIDERISARTLNLKAAKALFAASSGVTREEWRTFVSHLEADGALKGVQGMGFAKYIHQDDLQKEILKIRAEGFPEFTVRPEGERSVYSAIVYLEPFDARNQRAFGYDMYSEPVRHEAMQRALDNGEPALSGKVQLMQENGKDVQPGVLIYVPIYKNGALTNTIKERQNNLQGWAYSPFRMNNMIAGILTQENDTGTSTQAYSVAKTLGLRIYNGNSINDDTLLYDNLPDQMIDPDSPFNYRQLLTMYGQQWLLVYSSPAMASEVNYSSVTLVGLIGALATLLTLALLSYLYERIKDLRETKKLMHALQKSEAEVRQLSLTDPLTGLANRRLLDDRINQVALHCQRNQKFAGLILFDLDKFKPLNDTYGHAAGDQVLVEVARRINQLVRATDTVSRMGGDEFSVLLDDLGEEQALAIINARRIAETICTALAEPYSITDQSGIPVPSGYLCSASLGVAIFNDQVSMEQAHRNADAALYKAKSNGGRCVG